MSTDKNKGLDGGSSVHRACADRRRVLRALVAGAGATVLLPEKWGKPIVDRIIVPAHAQATVSCVAPAGCYALDGEDFSFFWAGGQGPWVVSFFPGDTCTGPEPSGEQRYVVASSQEEAAVLLGIPALIAVLVNTLPAPSASCNFYFDAIID
jgi:hypothetical protein